jgi:hypothetical protein
MMSVVTPLFAKPRRPPPVRRPDLRDQLDGLRADLAAASAETRDPIAAEELVSAARRVRAIIQRLEAGV